VGVGHVGRRRATTVLLESPTAQLGLDQWPAELELALRNYMARTSSS
jgi:hypothetical protein